MTPNPTHEQIEAAKKIVSLSRSFNFVAYHERTVRQAAEIIATRDARIIAEARAEVWEEASILADKQNCPVMRDDCERGYYRACEQITAEMKDRAAAERANLSEGA